MAIEILSPNYILPDNDVWLLKGVPLENNYENTILWQQGINVDGTVISNESPSEAKERQFNYFTATVGLDTRYHHLHLPAMTYLREGRKYLRVDLPYTRAIQYNYLIFKNNGEYTVGGSTTAYHYEHRYYYAFITKCEYLNDKTTIIHYEIDLLQTYNFDYAIEQCFVEREHSATDMPGDNTLIEKVNVGERICNGIYDNSLIFSPELNWTVVASTINYTYGENDEIILDETNTGDLINGQFQGVCFLPFNHWDDRSTRGGLRSLRAYIEAVTRAGKGDAIVCIFMMPIAFLFNPLEPSDILPGLPFSNTKFWPKEISVNIPLNVSTTNGWSYNYNGKIGPRNKKLYSGQFTNLIVYNGNGVTHTYSYELWNNNLNASFKMHGMTTPTPEIDIVPYHYKNIEYNWMEKLTLSNYPLCSYNIDAYKAWLAQQKGRLATTGASILGQGIVAGLTGNPIAIASTVASAFTRVTEIVGEGYQKSILPPVLEGSITPSLSMTSGEIGFKMYSFRPKDEYASLIDDYFDLYGYSTNQVKIPNRNVRPTWCYTKTIGCRLTSINMGIPADVDDAIRKIYDNGIRFWKNPEYIGNYSLNNQV